MRDVDRLEVQAARIGYSVREVHSRYITGYDLYKGSKSFDDKIRSYDEMSELIESLKNGSYVEPKKPESKTVKHELSAEEKRVRAIRAAAVSAGLRAELAMSRFSKGTFINLFSAAGAIVKPGLTLSEAENYLDIA